MNGYAPDDNDLDWLAGLPNEPIDPGNKEQMEWRRAQSAKTPSKKDYGWLVGVIVTIAFILLAIALAGNTWSPTTGNSPESGAQGCSGGEASGAGC
jgi:hypothetical protein